MALQDNKLSQVSCNLISFKFTVIMQYEIPDGKCWLLVCLILQKFTRLFFSSLQMKSLRQAPSKSTWTRYWKTGCCMVVNITVSRKIWGPWRTKIWSIMDHYIKCFFGHLAHAVHISITFFQYKIINIIGGKLIY